MSARRADPPGFDDAVARLEHDLRSPFAAARGALQILCEDGGTFTRDQRELLDLMGRSLARCEDLVRDLHATCRALVHDERELLAAPAALARVCTRINETAGGMLVAVGDVDALELRLGEELAFGLVRQMVRVLGREASDARPLRLGMTGPLPGGGARIFLLGADAELAPDLVPASRSPSAAVELELCRLVAARCDGKLLSRPGRERELLVCELGPPSVVG